MTKKYSLKKCRKILRTYYAHFKKHQHRLSQAESEELEQKLHELDHCCITQDRAGASEKAQQLEAFTKVIAPRTGWDIFKEVFGALLFALIVAFAIRQFWFELYEVPTGSMRPTILELDRLLVSKTTFGIHFPFNKRLTFYKPEYIKRAGTIVFTAAGMEMADPDMVYFGLFKGKKRLVKRNVSKPGDTLYFYGGRIYGIDKDGLPFTELSDPQFLARYHLEKINHVPYISFVGKPLLSDRTRGGYFASAVFRQMNLPVGRITASPLGAKGEFFNGETWAADEPGKALQPHHTPVTYAELWGMNNFAEVRLLTREQIRKIYDTSIDLKGDLFLEIQHNANMTYPKPEIRQGESGQYFPQPTPYVAFLPVDQAHLNKLLGAMTTSRFCVDNGGAHDYRKGRVRPQPADFDPKVPQVKNGCYELYYGKGSNVHFGGYKSALPATSPLYHESAENIQRLFNQGMRWNLVVAPRHALQPFSTSRYAFFRDGDLYIMDAPIYKKDDPLLQNFVQLEQEKEARSTLREPYIGFIDRGPPLKANGELDIDFIRAFGLKVPEDGIVALGDNYAASSDSRDFGFVPVHNLRGAPSFTFWPIGPQVGPLAQPPYPWVTFPNFLIWSLVLVIGMLSSIYYARRNRRSIFK